MKKHMQTFVKITLVTLSLLLLTACEADLSTVKSAAVKADAKEKTDVQEMAEDAALPENAKTQETGETAVPAEAGSVIDVSSGGIVDITKGGIYTVTGRTDNGMIRIDAGEKEEVKLILQDVSVTNPASAPIYVKSAGSVVITLEGENRLANGGTYEAVDENDIDAVIYSKDDLSFEGDGSLVIEAAAGHGIVCKDEMIINGGTYTISAKEDGMNVNDSLTIQSGTFAVTVGDDAIHADKTLTVNGGSFTIKGAEGLEATQVIVSDGTISIEASDDGINAAHKDETMTPLIEINGGEITITMAQGDTDGLDSNGDIAINGGTVSINAQFPADYDGTATITGGKLIINGEETDTLPNQVMGGEGGRGSENMAPIEGEMQMPQDGERPAFPEGEMTEGEPPAMPDGEMPNGERPMKPGGKMQKNGAFKQQNAEQNTQLSTGAK